MTETGPEVSVLASCYAGSKAGDRNVYGHCLPLGNINSKLQFITKMQLLGM